MNTMIKLGLALATFAVILAPMTLEAHSLVARSVAPVARVTAPAPAYVAPVRVHYNAAYTCSHNMYRSIACQ